MNYLLHIDYTSADSNSERAGEADADSNENEVLEDFNDILDVNDGMNALSRRECNIRCECE